MQDIARETRSIREATDGVRAMVQDSTTQWDHALKLLNSLLERLQLPSGSRLVEVKDDEIPLSSQTGPEDSPLLFSELKKDVTALLDAICDKRGVVDLDANREIPETLIHILETAISQQQTLGSVRRSIEEDDCKIGTQQLEILRRNLSIARGVLMSARTVSVNELREHKDI